MGSGRYPGTPTLHKRTYLKEKIPKALQNAQFCFSLVPSREHEGGLIDPLSRPQQGFMNIPWVPTLIDRLRARLGYPFYSHEVRGAWFRQML